MSNSDIGLIGLAVMGQNLALNLESKGFLVSVFNRTQEVTKRFAEGRAKGGKILPTYSLVSFVRSLTRPRKIVIMVKAGVAVDTTINQLVPLLEPGDIIIDGGNSLWTDTQRREKALRRESIHFIGCGISGGEEGALKGPSLMPGGAPDSWEVISPILRRIAAVVESEPCCLYMGPDGAGHYVKMVHNGIEYGDMQLICEAYAILKDVLGLSNLELHEVFSRWNNGELDSYLIGITAQILDKMDPDTGRPIVEVILDKAGQKGTGKWAIASAVDQDATASVLYAAIEARILSSKREERLVASRVLSAPPQRPFSGDRAGLANAVEHALYASKIVNYAQGMDLLAKASEHYRWNLNFGNIVAVWRGGCIIRAQFLNRIKRAYENKPDLRNLMLDPFFCSVLSRSQEGWRSAISVALQNGVPVPAFGAGLAYYDSYRSPNLPANLIQAQRDFFGAHTYERVDKPGVFHTKW
ncbi:6-phosphogluconate dehydrogenase, NADP(+)-dependent, decarboxylating [Candidatus Xiphinematobacter sp. Idaho Grape]|uniref:NADP-dependent phosphogluconate dehydrogenase n=1 Tax=Candidatus Xiphinematobacter sp. Idaho Grape TaxID=1704307 RepID=UPI000706414F|nr:NADP-dependent phosphogluconate dehydrogenase [Candidatus Xiphinematobacter sp. Idaho Grape]ALJ56467.1 6-phosphogluconate dehydrogenase, NADP(+)-dependent, decarboxylating [Candidatus Xiphinematobacter sp. Idaho Grape]